MKEYFKLIRVKHYLKNLLIFFPLFFSHNLFNLNLLLKLILSFLSFCFACSIVYIVNDIKDRDKDKLHEKKKNRPIASEKISIKNALFVIFILVILSGLCFFFSEANIFAGIYIIIYIFINLLYSFGLKNVPLLDIMILSSGFLIRVLFGGAVVDIDISNWLYLTVISMAFYLVIGKRRNEINNSKGETRKVLKYYTKDFLDKNMYMCLSLAIVFYSLWTMDYSSTNSLLVWTVPLVIIICMKYSMNVENGGDADPIEVVYSDKMLLFLIVIYGLSLVSVIYLF